MLTPHDIEVKKFERSFKGYKPSEVDEFLDALTIDYESLYKENAVLKSKMAVLVEKIEEYKAEEGSLRNALVSAQKMGESMLKEANMRSENIISEAASKAERTISMVNEQIIQEKRALEEARRETQLFKAKVIALLNSQIELLDGIPAYSIEDSLPVLQAEEEPGELEENVPEPEYSGGFGEMQEEGSYVEAAVESDEVYARAPWEENDEETSTAPPQATYGGFGGDEKNEYSYGHLDEDEKTLNPDFEGFSGVTAQEY